MPNNAKCYPDVIAALKQVREERHLTLNDIHRMLAQQEKDHPDLLAPSERTVQKIFAVGGEAEKFYYTSTLLPIVTLLLGIKETPSYDASDGKLYYEQADALRAIIAEKNERIEALELENERLLAENAQLRKAKDYVKEQLENAWKVLQSITRRD